MSSELDTDLLGPKLVSNENWVGYSRGAGYLGPSSSQQAGTKVAVTLPTTTFWMVWVPSTNRNPAFKHATYDSAKKEAQRLARSNKAAYILQAVELVQAGEPPITHTILDAEAPTT